jgi:peptidoglycan/xylan/chitin deacetylase (PgdA/CDA1 family)
MTTEPLAIGPAPGRVAAFGYHEVSVEPLVSGFRRRGAIQFTVTPHEFEQHLMLAASAGAEPVLVSELYERAIHRPVLLTFDDGGKSAMYAAEALARRGWRGHFFVITGRIADRTFLDAGEIRELRAQGHLIGSHSHSHPDIFRDLSFDRMVGEWRDSRDRVADLLGEECTSAAVPGGHISPAVLRSADAAGLRSLFTCDPVLVPRLEGGCQVFGRFLVKRTTSRAHMAALLDYEGWRTALLVRRTKDIVRRAAPALFRLYLARRTRESSEYAALSAAADSPVTRV